MMNVLKIALSSLQNLMTEPSEYMSEQRTRMYLVMGGVPI